MTKQEFQRMIAEEVQRQLKIVVPKMVKPLVQEAVAGALASLLAEGITRSPEPVRSQSPTNPSSRPINRPGARPATPAPRSAALSEAAKRSLASKMGYGSIDRIGEPMFTGSGGVSDILNETAMSMGGEGFDTPSILDAVTEAESVTTPDVVEAISRDYSVLMNRMKERGMIRG